MNLSYSQQSFFQRYRIQVIERWPRSERQVAALQAAQAALLRDVAYERAATAAARAWK
ncbi:MAG TPA: hypothetical protein VNY05_22485 [Candidatus Acidoferrales bacterium]|jgi:hypothetical protein|nr:hypothetical protein [Candidatus Acidoferrales bacterium]